MKNTFKTLNIIFIIIEAILLFSYRAAGGTVLKGITSGGFVVIGLINLIYAVTAKCGIKYPSTMFLGLFTSMIGDVVLQYDFMIGAVIFALGHIFYFIAFCTLKPYANRDAAPSAILFIGAAALLTLAPIFDFGSSIMLYVCLFYALIISFMLGKAIANYLKERTAFYLVVVIGAALFFFSDLMLVLSIFGGAPKIADTMCLFSYWPAQTLFAFTGFLHINQSE